jgi:hypothetical protein
VGTILDEVPTALQPERIGEYPVNRIPRSLLWIGGIIALPLPAVLILSLLDWNALRGPLSRRADPLRRH